MRGMTGAAAADGRQEREYMQADGFALQCCFEPSGAGAESVRYSVFGGQ